MVMSKLVKIQQKLKAPKGQYNGFGKYYYRSCEDIMTAVKPLCAEHDAVLTVTDDMVLIGERFYVKATATLHNLEGTKAVSVSAFARESDSKAGMDSAQITGSASSYARKYALNGLFCIDDTKDADALPPSESKPSENKASESKVSAKQIADLQSLAKQKGVAIEAIVSGYSLASIKDISPAQYQQAMGSLKKRADA